MKRFLIICLAIMFVVGLVGVAAAKNPLRATEKAGHKKLTSIIPTKMVKGVDDLYKVWKAVMAGKSKAVLLDVRTHPEFNAFHIARSLHIHSGHFYTIPKKFKDANTEIWVYCRTQHRAGYVAAFLYKWGYKKVYWVKKGLVGWLKKGYPVVNFYIGQIDKVTYAKPPKWILKVDKCVKPACVREWNKTR